MIALNTQSSELAKILNLNDEQVRKLSDTELDEMVQLIGGPDMMGFVGHVEGEK